MRMQYSRAVYMYMYYRGCMIGFARVCSLRRSSVNPQKEKR